ncbi:hypothetical protein BpHYR1_023453 [Brachionus plicatilis]|uniref:Uncharacterized protein n=1 Tax=Brachionus plicatilis TaxID=10195 RepID=A0A3M7PWT9_BRAPC|nr:hypothetical protein BpHYR1_023453 [Brachionus plicatilis]
MRNVLGFYESMVIERWIFVQSCFEMKLQTGPFAPPLQCNLTFLINRPTIDLTMKLQVQA